MRVLRCFPLLLAGLPALLLALSCTPEQQHGLLTTFFDGVPPIRGTEAEAKAKAKGKAQGTAAEKAEASREPELPKAAAIVWSEHKPTLDNAKCGACHDRNASFALLRPVNVLCLQCHQATAREAPLMHGPVAVGECSLCHEAHRSPYPHLTKAPQPKLCFGCHDRTPPGGKTLGCPRSPDEETCTTCHRPHGGKDRFFLKGVGAPKQ